MTTTEPAVKSFADFGVDDRICESLAADGITTPFPIQEITLPLALSGADLIGQARTGTGKTLAFGIPLLQRADPDDKRTQALVIVPTRELCLQVRDDLALAGAARGVSVVAVYGGKSIDAQVEAIQAGAPIVVGTPGRLLDLLGRGSLVLSTVTGLVLDEADEMLDLGFLPDVEQLIQATADRRQTLLFSATMPSAVVALARRYMHKPTFLRADVEEVRIGPDTKQYFFSCHRMDKPAVLARILTDPSRGLCVVFSRTKRMADTLVEDLRSQGVKAAAIHSDLRQEARERALAKFRKGTIDVLVATEVAARGLDITDVTHVVNYDCPDDEKMYLHRIGRTGRAGAAGVAITMAVWNEAARLEMIKKALGITDPTHEVFSTSPILDELFDLPPKSTAKPVAAVDDDDDDVPEARRPRTDAGETRARGSRGRRGGRGRRDGRGDDAQETTPTRADDDEAAPDATPTRARDDEAGTSVRRVRTRRRSVRGEAETPPPSTTEDVTDAGSVPDDVAPARREAKAPARPPRDGSTRSGQSSRQPARSEGRSGRGGRSGRSRSTRGNQGGSGGERTTSRSTGPQASERVDVETARAGGRPRLVRPLVISHLP